MFNYLKPLFLTVESGIADYSNTQLLYNKVDIKSLYQSWFNTTTIKHTDAYQSNLSLFVINMLCWIVEQDEICWL